MIKALAVVMVVMLSGLAVPASAHDRVKSDRRVVVVDQSTYPRTAWERFLFDYNYCSKGFSCGGAD